MGQLNELQIKAAQPRNKEYMLSDGEGLDLRVRLTDEAWATQCDHGFYQLAAPFPGLAEGEIRTGRVMSPAKRSRADDVVFL